MQRTFFHPLTKNFTDAEDFFHPLTKDFTDAEDLVLAEDRTTEADRELIMDGEFLIIIIIIDYHYYCYHQSLKLMMDGEFASLFLSAYQLISDDQLASDHLYISKS